jgi:hypothetical protein
MNTWLTKSKQSLDESIFDFLWRRWSDLGIAGGSKVEDSRITDPEALLLFSLGVCRYEPRLFDEIIDWLNENGQIINVQRLQRIQKKYDFNCGPQLSAVAELLSQKSTYKLKWSGLAKKYKHNTTRPLFLDKNGNPLPSPAEDRANREFISHGLVRGDIKLRGYSGSFDFDSINCLLLRLRALFGINARAEILCLLASVKEIHPTRAAMMTGYYQKTIQTTLVEMSRSGIVLCRTSKKEKYYSLKPDILDNLLKPAGQNPKWINWPEFLKIIEILWDKVLDMSKRHLDEILLISELNKLIQTVNNDYPENDFTEFCVLSNTKPEHFSIEFQRAVTAISNRL